MTQGLRHAHLARVWQVRPLGARRRCGWSSPFATADVVRRPSDSGRARSYVLVSHQLVDGVLPLLVLHSLLVTQQMHRLQRRRVGVVAVEQFRGLWVIGAT